MRVLCSFTLVRHQYGALLMEEFTAEVVTGTVIWTEDDVLSSRQGHGT